MKRLLMAVAILVAVAVGIYAWWYFPRRASSGPLVLYGNLDLRQIEPAFNNNERIASVLVYEGDRVHPGDVLARLDTRRLQPQYDEAEAQVAALQQVVERLRAGSRPQEIAQAKALLDAQAKLVEKLHNGTRPEEIEQAKANVDSAQAEVINTRKRYERLIAVKQQSTGGTIAQEEIDLAKSLYDVAEAKRLAAEKAWELAKIGPRKEEIAEAEAQLEARRQAYELVVAGPRKEEIAEAEARLEAAKAQRDEVRQKLADAELVAPQEAIVRTRLMEPGEMASPQRPVVSLAVIDPKWVRAYVSEPDLGKVQYGMAATVKVDSFPNQPFEGWVGFISPVAEFTPKNVQTEELRTSLVYEVRVFVKDPADRLRLGMPATVTLKPEAPRNPPLAQEVPTGLRNASQP
jgi:HlyD family secretion protein